MATIILINNDELVKNTILGGNIDKDRYVSSIKIAQNTYIKPLLGDDLYNKICQDYFNDTLTGLYNTLYEDFVKDLVIHSATMYYLTHGAYMVSNNGITKMRSDSAETVSKEELDFLVDSSKKLYYLYERNFLKWIKANPLTEYKTNESARRINIGGWTLRKRGNCENNC